MLLLSSEIRGKGRKATSPHGSNFISSYACILQIVISVSGAKTSRLLLFLERKPFAQSLEHGLSLFPEFTAEAPIWLCKGVKAAGSDCPVGKLLSPFAYLVYLAQIIASGGLHHQECSIRRELCHKFVNLQCGVYIA